MDLISLMSQTTYQKVKQYFEDNNISFEERSHAPGASAEDYHKALGCRYEQQAKCLLIRTKNNGEKKFYILAIPATKKADLDQLKTVLGVNDTKLAQKEDLKQLTDCDYGELPPIANPFNLKLIMDKDLLTEAEIYMNAGKVDVSFVTAPGNIKQLEDPILI